jgi:hypothetical protein
MNTRLVLGAIVMMMAIATLGTTTLFLRAEAGIFNFGHERKAPSAISGDNVYIAWQSNNTANGNEDVIFRASTDGGASFGDKINLSNTTNADSSRVEIAGEGPNVIVSWWETNQTSDTPVSRISTDSGQTFGPVLRLATNGTIGEAEGTEEGDETGQ